MNDPTVLDEIEAQLYTKWPSWTEKHDMHEGGGRTTTHTKFMQEEKTFLTAKSAYIWLIERMLESRGKMSFSEMSGFVANGEKGGRYIAQTLDDLFPGEPKKQKDQNKWYLLANGWVLNLCLNNPKKFDRLARMGAILGYEYEKDWSWRIEGSGESDLSDLDALLEVEAQGDR